MGRGGRRPGAGAPKGNLNGYKHGRNSQQFKRLVELISDSPEAVELITEISASKRREEARARREAERYILELLQRLSDMNDDLHTARYELTQRIPPRLDRPATKLRHPERSEAQPRDLTCRTNL
jgi:hypothetical protein